MNTDTHIPIISVKEPLLPSSSEESQELPGVKEVLMNSLRINKKLHGEIVAREHSVRSETQQASLRLNSLYRDMQEVYSKTQQLYQETVRQNQKTRYMAEELLRPFREELKGKVDETTLSLKMKMMLSQFDNLGHKISYDRDGKPMGHDDSHTFRFVKTELLPLLSQVQQDLREKTVVATQQQEELTSLRNRQAEFSQELINNRNQILQMRASLLQEISSSVSEQVWESRFNNFYQTFIRSSITPIANTLNSNYKQFTADIGQIKTEISLLKKNIPDPKMMEALKKIEEMKVEVGKMGRLVQGTQTAVTELKKGLEDTKTSLRTQLNKITENISREQINALLQQNKSMRLEIEETSRQLQSQLQVALQSNDKGVVLRVNRLDSQVKTLSQNLKNTLKQLQGQQREISFVKELLSQKANFTDIIVHTQNKADKQDYRELKHLIEASGSVSPLPDTLPEELESCMVTQEQPKDVYTPTPNRFRRRESTTSGHRVQQQQSVSPYLPDSQRDESVKRYMLGLRNGSSNYTRENLLKEKSRFLFLNQTERRQAKTGRRGETFTENFV